MLWELLTGGRLFDGSSDVAVLRSVQESLIVPPVRLNPDVPQELSDITVKALSRAVSERYQTAFELERALATFVLRASQSVDDANVGHFMQEVFRPEYESDHRQTMPLPRVEEDVSALENEHELAHAPTMAVDHARRVPQTMTATPTEQQLVEAGVLPEREGTATQLAGAAKVGTEPMVDVRPLAPASVIADPAPELAKTSPWGEATPDPGASSAVQKARTPWVMLGAAAGALVLVVAALAFSRDDAPVQVTPAVVKAPVVEVPVEKPHAVMAAGGAPEPVAVPEVAPPPVRQPKDDARPVPAAAPTAAAEAAPASARPATGRLIIRATPYATVKLGSRGLGDVEGVREFSVAPGTYLLVLEHRQWRHSQRVVVPRSGSLKVSFDAMNQRFKLD